MKVLLVYTFCFILPFIVSGQTEIKKTSWFKDNVDIRKTFDGSKNENKPATFALYENHKSNNDFFSADVAIKFIEWELLQNSRSIITLFPVIEYHRSSNDDEKKDKLSAGLNGEYYFGSNWNLKPYLLSNFVFKRNLLENINEIKYVAQISFFGTKPGQSGFKLRFDNKQKDYRGMYYPYFGYEFNKIPDLISEGNTESISFLFFRLHLEHWISFKAIQIIANGIYRSLISDNTLKEDLPLLNLSLNYYPGNQDNISIGLDYKNGYDPGSKFTQVEITSLSLNIKF